MQRRLLIPVLCLSLASLAPAPLSACAMLMTVPPGCAPAAVDAPANTSNCEQEFAGEETNQDALQTGTSELPCCKLKAAPIPDAGTGISKAKVAPAFVAAENAPQRIAVKTLELEWTAALIDLEQFASPPDRQPLLCTFLI